MILLLVSINLGFALLAVYLLYFLLMGRYRRHKGNWKKGTIWPKISLIIATYNEEYTLPSKLKNILELNYPKEMMELVIIDSGSTDKTPEIAYDFIKSNPKMTVVLIREKERLGKAHALNIAYPKACGTIKIISDSDAFLEKDAITQIVSNFYDETVGAACGRQILLNANENPSTRLEKSYRNIYQVLREGESALDSTPVFHGELSAYRANLLERLPENKSADDSRQANEIRKKGFRSVYDSEAIFYEYAPSTSESRTVQKVRRGQGLIRVFWDFKGCMFRRKYGAYGMLILPVEFFLHCIFPTLWMLTFALFLLGTLLFSWVLFATVLVVLACSYGLSRMNSNNSIHKKFRAGTTLLSSFFSFQFFLFYGFLLWISGRSLHKWQKVEDVRKNYCITKDLT